MINLTKNRLTDQVPTTFFLKKGLGDNISEEDVRWLQKLEVYASSHLGDFDFTLDVLEIATSMGSRQLRRKLERLTGLKPNEYLRELRLQKAKKMLETAHHMRVKEVAEAVGLRDVKHFSKLFKKRFSILPSKVRI